MALATVVGAMSGGCSTDAPARGQWVVEVDTNAPLVGQLAGEPHWSDVAVDTLRVDIDGVESEEFVLPDTPNWPVSFGVLPPSDGTRPTVRLRAFRAARATPEPGQSVSNPIRSLAIDRLLELPPIDAVTRVRVVLDLGCIGVLSQFGSAPATCLDAEHASVSPAASGQIVDGPRQGTLAGTSPFLEVAPCQKAASPDRVCIPGGLSVVGDPALSGVGNATILASPAPPRALRFRPFWIDRTEVTVGRFKTIAGKVSELPDTPGGGLLKHCTWLGSSDASHDDWPLNCVSRAVAAEACALFGGKLPTEAQWEHAARGRGRGYRYPWGDAQPLCCRASMDRLQGNCASDAGPEPVGSHTGADCGGLGDVSDDGVLDLAGSLTEFVLGDLLPYDDACWPSGTLPLDPECNTGLVPGTRGGVWSSRLQSAALALRLIGQGGAVTDGFRCVYEDVP